MTETVLDRLGIALDDAARSDSNVFDPPVAILWPDKGRQWEGSIARLRQRRQVLTLGPHNPSSGTGPAYWLRCVAAGTLEIHGPGGLPVIYLPGVSRDDLRSVATSNQALAPLAPLQHRSQWFTQSSGKDWTVRALLINQDRGLGLSVAGDDSTSQALIAGLGDLVQLPLSRLKERYIDAPFLNGLLNPDPIRRLLQWIDDPVAVRQELGDVAWNAFVAQCESDFDFDPATAGVVEAARKLGTAEGAWVQVWQRFREAPGDYPGIHQRLRDARPMELFTPSGLAWPQDNEAAEDQLRNRLLDLASLTAAGAASQIAQLEDSHRERRGSVWAQLGKSPLAFAVEHLANLAAKCTSAPPTGNVEQLRGSYATGGWTVDLEALQALGEVDHDRDMKAVAAALDALYRPWVEAGARALQDAVGPEANSGTYVASDAPNLSASQVVMFVDGLRLDVAHLLAERLEGAGAKVAIDIGLAALPTVTHTSKPALVPINQALLGPGAALDACRVSSGATAGVQTLRSLLAEASVQVLTSSDFGDPAGRAWTEAGDIDRKGHSVGSRLAHEIEGEVTRIARRTRELLDTGWSVVSIVTDHGWILLPSGLPKNDSLPVAATAVKKGRCARLKDGASADVSTVPWHWDNNVRIAIAPGVSCFEANKTYEHGGISPQECFVPRLTITASEAATSSSAEITRIKWRGLTLVVEFTDLPEGAKVDLRRQAGDAASSIADLARFTSGTGKIILLVDDEDLEGATAQLVVVDADGTILLQRETTVGQNR
ncbi:hypothetical protein A5707_03915 [Mycobacterium kyorinense]|uniref:Alkaline phosphatase n=1 Tax=Mycobacterium kyorinense TaxID=487514 RepID=A0A1A2Z0W0_9MYCO|nr:BREX-1 system phosphatase PglZ type B [Mycobacterium kyorinense]OBI43925.1 hypothetical protein A5707_03915 [Mycobacterium kyorinense]